MLITFCEISDAGCVCVCVFRFSIDARTDPLRQFTVDGHGLVTTRRALDRETQPSHRVHVLAVDKGISTVSSQLLAVWCSGNALVSINAVALHRARLVLGWVTAFGQVNCLIT